MKNMPDANQPAIDAIYKKTLSITLSDGDTESEARLCNGKDTKVAKYTSNPHSRFLRTTRCGECPRCVEKECGHCSSCLDMSKYGGQQRVKQACIDRQCQHKRFKHRDAGTQPSIATMFKVMKTEADGESNNYLASMKTEYFETEDKLKMELIETKNEPKIEI